MQNAEAGLQAEKSMSGLKQHGSSCCFWLGADFPACRPASASESLAACIVSSSLHAAGHMGDVKALFWSMSGTSRCCSNSSTRLDDFPVTNNCVTQHCILHAAG